MDNSSAQPPPATASMWTQGRVEALIGDGIEESLTLEYKAAAALAQNQQKKTEITKDVSAFANSAGGTLVYGISEYSSKERQHLPERLDPVDRSAFSREWLEHVIGNIRPRIRGLVIHPVVLDTGAAHTIYVVEIPQGTTAHQATDFRYYRRFNFEAVPMADHEVRDVMARSQHPRILLEFSIQLITKEIREKGPPFSFEAIVGTETRRFLSIRARNTGQVLARFVNAFVDAPSSIFHESESRTRRSSERRPNISTVFIDNTQRDVIDVKLHGFGLEPTAMYGPSWFEPLLPGLALPLSSIRLEDRDLTTEELNLPLEWTVHADNAASEKGTWSLTSIQIVDHRRSTQESRA